MSARTRLAGLLAVATACTWVPVTPEARRVEVSGIAAVASCEHVGVAQSKVWARSGPFHRSDRGVQRDLENLARDEATRLGGDTIVPRAAPDNGRQSYDVYRCQP